MTVIASSSRPVEHSTSCTQCGGTTREVPGQNYLQCSYCQSLAFPHGSPLATDAITPMGGELEAQCPCCHDTLQTGEVDNHRALYCGRCYGVLIRNAAFGEVVRNRRAKRKHQEFADVRPVDASQLDRTLQCPNCRKRMDTHPYYGPGNVVIDSCGDCGYIWLDHGELATLERAAGRSESKPEPVPYSPPISVATDLAARPSSPFEVLLDLFS